MQTVFTFAPLFAELQTRGWFPMWLAIALGVLAAIAIGVLYVKESGRLGPAPRMAMALVRTAIVLIIAFLLLRPVWASEEESEKIRPVGVLIDVSLSMDNNDPRPNTDDQWRAAMAFGLIEPDKGLPLEPISNLGDRLPNKPKRIEVARAALINEKFDFFPRLAKAGPLQVYTFGSGSPTGRDEKNFDWLKTLTATESETALVGSAFDLLNRDNVDAPSSIVIVTDGRENAGPKSLTALADECKLRKIPIYVYGVGSSAFGQLQTAFGAAGDKTDKTRAGADVDVPNTLFVDDTAAIPVRYTVKGITEGTAKIVVKYGDREVATKEEKFTLAGEEVRTGKTFSSVLRFVPKKVDADSKKQEYSATVTVTAGTGAGADTITNEISRPAQVVNRKLKILWVDSLPRRDFQFLQRDLLRDRRIEAKFYLTEGDKAAMRSGPPWMVDFSREVNGILGMDREEFRKILFDFDLLILGDVPGKYFTKDHQEVIKEFVTEGGGLIHIAGRWHAPADWANEKGAPKSDTNPIADVLPVEFDPVRFPIQALDNPLPFVPVLAPAASRTQIVTLDDDPEENATIWGKLGPPLAVPPEKQLKPLYWYYPVTKVKPAADVFLVHPTARTPAPDNKPMPLLVGHYYGKGYALYCGFDDTWRWRFNNQSKLSGRFWTQAIYTAGIPRIVGTKLTQVSSNTPAPIQGTVGEIYVRVFNENFLPLTVDEIEGTLENLTADPNDKDKSTPVKFRKVPGVDGEYVTTLPYNKVGQFRLTVDPKNKSPATLNFPVNYPDNHERSPGTIDEPAMRKLCEETGGKFYREEDLINLPNDVKITKVPQLHRQETLLWNEWAMITLIVLLTLEWFMRKFNGLS